MKGVILPHALIWARQTVFINGILTVPILDFFGSRPVQAWAEQIQSSAR
ncbi:MAG: hypothetical protein V7K48_21245 [Nostoc sp.]